MNSDDYKKLFFDTIGRSEGEPADDYELVLGTSGIPAGYGPHIKPDCAKMPLHAMTQQVGSDGRIAGRIFLPASGPDDLGYHTHPFSPLKDGPTSGSLVWEWRDLNIGQPVTDPCNGANQVPPKLEWDQVVAMLRAAVGSTVRIGSKIALRVDSGKIMGIDGGGSTKDNQPIKFITKTDIHAWETFKVEKGE